MHTHELDSEEMNDSTPRVELVVPLLNEAHVLEQSVATIHQFLSQGFPYRWSILLADNGSTDGTIEVAEQLSKLSLPSNIRVMKLPDLPECRSFPTVGPGGVASLDVNGRAVAIEMFLDLAIADQQPRVRWTGFNKKLQRYQGELVGKVEYIKQFLCPSELPADYDLSKLRRAWDCIYETCAEGTG